MGTSHFYTQMGGKSTQTQTYSGRRLGVGLQCWLEALPDRPAQLYKPHRRRVRKQQSKLATHRHTLTQRGGCAHTQRPVLLTRRIHAAHGRKPASKHTRTPTHIYSLLVATWVIGEWVDKLEPFSFLN